MSKPIKREFGNRAIPAWVTGAGGEKFTDITYQVGEGMAKIAINRPDVRNAFRPQTIIELQEAFSLARDNSDVGVIIFTGTGDEAFCSGGDISVRGDDGYLGDDPLAQKGIGRLNVLDLQIQIRRTPKPVVAMVAGWAIGGGHVLHVVCDITIAADNALFGQTGPMVGSFDGGYGSGLLAANVEKESGWFLTQDIGVILDGKLKVIGRADDVIISGGENISLSAIESELNKKLEESNKVMETLKDMHQQEFSSLDFYNLENRHKPYLDRRSTIQYLKDMIKRYL